MGENRLVSIIVPIYKVESYIEKCILSLLAQTYKNIEVLLIDDGSPDKCGEICEKWKKKDGRIKVIHKENGGLSDARKVGINEATGKYIMIVDGDDWIDPMTVEECIEIAERKNVDCVLYSYVREYGDVSIDNPLFEKSFFYSNKRNVKEMHRKLVGPLGEELHHPEKVDNLSSVCMKLYRRDIAQRGKIVSEKIVGTSEDTIFNLYALEKCEKIAYINKCYYHYRKDNAHSIVTVYKKHLSEKWDVLYQIFQQYLIEHNVDKEYEQAFLNRVACGMIGLGLNEINSKEGIWKQSKEIKRILQKKLYIKAFQQLEFQYLPFHWKIFFALCKKRWALLLTILLHFINRLRRIKI